MTAHDLSGRAPLIIDSSDSSIEEVRADEQGVHPAPAMRDESKADLSHEDLDGLQSSLEQHLEALVQVLASRGPSQNLDDDEQELSSARDTPGLNSEESSYEAIPKFLHQADESLAARRSRLNPRVYGFIAGVGLSVAVGGAMAFALGTSEPGDAASESVVLAERPLPLNPGASLESANLVPRTGLNTGDVLHSEGFAAVSDVLSEESSKSDHGSKTVAARDEIPEGPEKPSDEQADLGSPNELAHPQNSAETTNFETTVSVAPAAEEQTPVANTNAAEELDVNGDVPQPGQARTARVIDYVNMRAGPNSREPILAIVPEGSAVEVVRCTHWCEVIFAGRSGWIYKNYIDVANVSGLSEEDATKYN